MVSIMAKSGNITTVHVTALDAIVNVNTLFTAIVFLGISFNTNTSSDLTSCKPGPNVSKRLVVFEVISFSCFLFSSLVAQGLKIHINILNSNDRHQCTQAYIEQWLLNFGVTGSGVGSVVGCVFLMLSMVDVIQVKLGTLSCLNKYTVPAVTVLVVLVSSAVVIYFYSVGNAVKEVYFDPPETKEAKILRSGSGNVGPKETELVA